MSSGDHNPRPRKKRKGKTIFSSLKFKSAVPKPPPTDVSSFEDGHISDDDEHVERNSAYYEASRSKESKAQVSEHSPRHGPATSNESPLLSVASPEKHKPKPRDLIDHDVNVDVDVDNELFKIHLLDAHVSNSIAQAEFYHDIYTIDLSSFPPPASLVSLIAELRDTGRETTNSDLARADLDIWARDVQTRLFTTLPTSFDDVPREEEKAKDRDYAAQEQAYSLLDELRRLEARRRLRARKDAEESAEKWPLLWETYLSHWTALSGLSHSGLPWPTETLSVETLTAEAIRGFFNGVAGWKARTSSSSSSKNEVLRAILKAERVRWHPDRVAQRFARGGMRLGREDAKRVTMVFQVLDDWYGSLK